MINGANIRYRIPIFNECAGPSPNWDAVLVHILHCESTDCAPQIKVIIDRRKRFNVFMKNRLKKKVKDQKKEQLLTQKVKQ